MRVYEFAKKVGATCAAVMKMAEEKGVEVYSPLSQLEPEDVETLNKQLLAVGPAAVKEEAAAAGERARAKAARAAAARAVHDKAQAEALEAARQRAIAAHEGRALSLPVPPPAVTAAPKPVAAPKAEERKVEIGVSLPELPKVSIQMGESEDEGASAASDFEDDEVDARDGLLSASSAVHIRSFALISCHILFLLSTIPNFGLLGCVGVLCTGENAQTLELPLSDGVLLKHAADCKTHCQLRALCHQVLILGLLQTADPAGVSTVVLLLELLAGQDCVLCVDDDDVIAAIDVRSIGGFELAAKQIGGSCSGLAEGLACCVKDVPFSFNGLLGKHCRGHICASKNIKYTLTF